MTPSTLTFDDILDAYHDGIISSIVAWVAFGDPSDPDVAQIRADVCAIINGAQP